MDIMTLAAKLTLDSGAYEKGLKRAEGGMARLGKTLSAKTVALGTFAGNMLTKATSAAFQALSNVVRSATDAYASYEQLTGGISTLFGTKEISNAKDYAKQIGLISEKVDKAGKTITTVNKKMAKTLFGDKTGKVTGKMTADEIAQRAYEQAEQAQKDAMDNAAKAYKSAGLSMNAYMDTATSLAASMNQATGGDTQKSASLIDMAIRDMADNANKMGTDMASVENAYRGFAKGNYTMLDNLKLGYGGTKTEMQRLLKDAATITGEKYQMGNLADMVKAINAIQKQQGITGTTESEAKGTIEGSKKMLSAAWENVLTALAAPDELDLSGALSSLTDSAKTYLNNLFPVVSNIMDGLGSFMEQVLPDIVEKIPELLADFVPKLVKAGGKMVEGLGKGLKKAFGKMKWPTWSDVSNAVGKAWETIEKGFDGLGKLIFGENADGTTKWPTWETVGAFVSDAWEGIKTGFFSLGKLIFGENADGTTKWPTWADVGTAVGKAWATIIDGVKNLGQTVGKAVFGENVDGEIDWPTWEEVGEFVGNAWKDIVQGVANLGTEIGKAVFGENVDGTIDWPTWEEVGTFIEDAWSGIVEGVKGLGTGIGKAIFGENVDGTIAWPTWEDVGSAIETAWQGIVDGVKNLGETIGKVVFGENVDGTIDWPTWEEVGTFIETAWQGIVDGVKNLGETIGKVVFGENVDGTIDWPTWDDIGQAVTEEWERIQSSVANLGQIVFGEDSTIGGAFYDALAWVQQKIKELKKLLGVDDRPKLDSRAQYELNSDVGMLNGSKDEQMQYLDKLTKKMQEAGYSAEQINDVKESIFKSGMDESWVTELVSKMGDADETAAMLLENLSSISKDWDVDINLKVHGELPEMPTQSYGQWKNDQMQKEYGHAKGLNTVPYDNYLASLHRGEMVLTKSQARQYREGGSGGGVDISAMAASIVAAVREGMAGASVNSYLDGKGVTDNVNRRTSNKLRARRFSMA